MDEIWENYDADNNGYLDRDETFKLACETMLAMDSPEVLKAQFEELFNKLDVDQSGRIVKLEMAHFIKGLLP